MSGLIEDDKYILLHFISCNALFEEYEENLASYVEKREELIVFAVKCVKTL